MELSWNSWWKPMAIDGFHGKNHGFIHGMSENDGFSPIWQGTVTLQ